MQILVGSGAAKQRLPNWKRIGDVDIWSTHDIKGVDNSVFPEEFLLMFEKESVESGVATLNDLLTIKLSHLPYDIFWRKHMNDYLVFKKHGGKVNKALYERLKVHWKEFHNNKPFLSLYRTKDSFFDDFVEKKYDHDRLHELVAYPQQPVYVSCLEDGQEVMIDKNKFFAMPLQKQVKMFREEINVIACERWVLNPACEGKISYMQAYSRALHKTVTALTKGWASSFICENLELFLSSDRKEVAHLLETVKMN